MPHSTNIESDVESLGPSLGHRPEDRDRYLAILSFLNVSKRILAKRLDLGLSQEALGKAAGSKQSKVSEIELMKGNPRFETLDKIASVLGLCIDLVPRKAEGWIDQFASITPTGFTTFGSGDTETITVSLGGEFDPSVLNDNWIRAQDANNNFALSA